MLKNYKLADQILDLIDTYLEAADYMYGCVIEGKYVQTEKTAYDMIAALKELYPYAVEIKKEIPFISAPVSCENIIYSVNNIILLIRSRSDRVLSKIEFELIPLLQEFHYDFYFFAFIFGDKEKEKKHYAEEFVKMGANHYIDESIRTGHYKYDVSIYVLAYNKLKVTKQCVENIIKYTPSDISYELFFINNGSTDGTQEYFESFKCNKEINLLRNNFSDIRAVRRIFEGKYVLSVSNDVIVTENYLTNLIACMESDPKIAMVVPTTPNVSNLQSIPAKYSTFEEMQEFAKKNNVSDFKRWEERTRLCNPLTLAHSSVFYSSQGVGAIDKYFVYSEFGDDALALRLRRAGYKLVLAKDCYCHHFGSVTLREAQKKDNTLGKSRKLFFDRYGVDAWGTGFCFDIGLMEALNIKKQGHAGILGVNSGFGSNPLKLKTLHKESGNSAAVLFYITDDERYIPDLQAYGDHVKYVPTITNDSLENILYDYILLEENAGKILGFPDAFTMFKSKLAENGTMAVCARNEEEKRMLEKYMPDCKAKGIFGLWYIWKI